MADPPATCRHQLRRAEAVVPFTIPSVGHHPAIGRESRPLSAQEKGSGEATAREFGSYDDLRAPHTPN
jgi:hypothetical protein